MFSFSFVLSQKRQFFAEFFGENILKITTSVPEKRLRLGCALSIEGLPDLIFAYENPNLGNFGGLENVGMFYCPFGIFYDHWVNVLLIWYFLVTWFILARLGML
jgi:hypothetical protein